MIKSENISNYLFIFPDFIRTIINVYLVNLTHYGKYGFKSDIKNRSSYNRSLNEKIFYN